MRSCQCTMSALSFARRSLGHCHAHRCFGTDARKIKVYTKTGDKGTSQLYTGERRDKAAEVDHALLRIKGRVQREEGLRPSQQAAVRAGGGDERG